MFPRLLVNRSLIVLMCFALVASYGAAPILSAAQTDPNDTPAATPIMGDENSADDHPPAGDATESDAVNDDDTTVDPSPEDIAPKDLDTIASPDAQVSSRSSSAQTSTVTVTVSMEDGSLIPYGYILTGSWDSYMQENPVAGAVTSVDVEVPVAVAYGFHRVTLESDHIHQYYDLNVDSPTENLQVELTPFDTHGQITLNTTDGGDVPAGTEWALMFGDNNVTSGVLDAPMASGGSFEIGPVSAGLYQFTVTPPAAGDRNFQTVSVEIDLYYNFDNRLSFELEIITPAGVIDFSVEMADVGNIPDGLQWTLYPSGSWDPIASGPITAGGTLFEHDIPEQLPYGLYQLWITGNGYSTGQTINVQSAEVVHGFKLTRLLGTAQVTLNTSDGGEIPAGTTIELMRGSTVVTSVTYESPLPAHGSIQDFGPHDFGVYDLRLTPPVDATGRQIVPQTIPVNMTNPWVTEYEIEANLEIFIPMSTVTVSVAMIDDGPIPMGLEWSLFPPGSWDPIATGPVTAGGLTFEHDIPEQVPFGVYQLWITGNGYSSGQVINVQAEEFRHGFPLTRLNGNLTITVTTNDGSDIPAGTVWEIRDANDVVMQSGTLADGLPNGGVLEIANPFEFGVYTLNIGPPSDMLVPLALADLPRELLPFSTTINITNPWFTEYPVAAELQWAQSDVAFSVTMSDNEPLPNGLEWMIVVSGSWDPLASGPVTAGEISFTDEVPEPAPYGVYQLWITGNGYSSGQVINIQSLTTHHDFVLDRLQADVIVTLDTSDEAAVPAGTTWSMVDSTGAQVQNGVLAESLASGSILPIANPLTFDVYTIRIDAEGYHPVTTYLSVTNPWLTEMSFDVTLVSDRLPAPDPDPEPEPEPPLPPITEPEPAEPDPTPEPEPTEPDPAPEPEPSAPATPDPIVPAPDKTPETPVTGLPQTGVGESGSFVMLMLLTGSLLAFAGGYLLRIRPRSIRS